MGYYKKHHKHHYKHKHHHSAKPKIMVVEKKILIKQDVNKMENKVGIIDKILGKGDALHIKQKYEYELGKSFKAIVDMVHFLEDKNIEIANNQNDALAYEQNIDACNGKLSKLYENIFSDYPKLNEFIKAERVHEQKMWGKTATSDSFNSNYSIKQKTHRTTIEDMNFNNIKTYITKYPEMCKKEDFIKQYHDIQKYENEKECNIKKYNYSIGTYNTHLTILNEAVQKAEDKIVAFENILFEGKDKLDKSFFRNNFIFKFRSEKGKEIGNIETLSFRVDQFRNTLKIIKERHAANTIEPFKKLSYRQKSSQKEDIISPQKVPQSIPDDFTYKIDIV